MVVSCLMPESNARSDSKVKNAIEDCKVEQTVFYDAYQASARAQLFESTFSIHHWPQLANKE